MTNTSSIRFRPALRWLVAILGISPLFFAGCTKNGTQGPPGNANVQVDTLTLTGDQWQYGGDYTFSTPGGGYTEYFTQYHDVAFNKITPGVLDSGLVLVYFTPNNNNLEQWAPLPYQFPSFGAEFYYNFVYETSDSNVRLHIFFTKIDPSATLPTISSYVPATYRFKILAISGNIAAIMRRSKISTLKYSDVKDFVGF
jgi:hypothetical protein